MQFLVQIAQFLEALVSLRQYRLLALDTFEQFIEVDGLLIVIGKALAQGPDHILFIGLPCEHDGFERAVFTGDLLQCLNQFDAIEPWHMQVTEHQVDVQVVAKLHQGLLAGMAGHAVVTVALQKLT
ncbi:hypothetical protein D3C76_1162180 [compost metagenome]